MKLFNLPITPFFKPALKTAVEITKNTDSYQESRNKRATNDVDYKGQQFIMDDIVYDRKRLEDKAIEHNLDFKEYMRRMSKNGMTLYTGTDASDDEISTKVNTLIERQEDALYNTDLTEDQIEKLKNKGLTFTAEDKQDVEYLYETGKTYLVLVEMVNSEEQEAL